MSGTKLFGIAGSLGSVGSIRLQSGQGAPAPPHLHALSPRNGRSTWLSQAQRLLSHRGQYFSFAISRFRIGSETPSFKRWQINGSVHFWTSARL